MRGNAKPFGKRFSPCAETSNHLGNDFRHARKHQTFCGMICGRPARNINEKSTLKKRIFKVLCKRRRLPTLPHCIAIPSTLATWPLLHHHQCFVIRNTHLRNFSTCPIPALAGLFHQRGYFAVLSFISDRQIEWEHKSRFSASLPVYGGHH